VPEPKPEWVGQRAIDLDKPDRTDPATALGVPYFMRECVPKPDCACTCQEFNHGLGAPCQGRQCVLVHGQWRVLVWLPVSLRCNRGRRLSTPGGYPHLEWADLMPSCEDSGCHCQLLIIQLLLNPCDGRHLPYFVNTIRLTEE